MQKLIYLSFIVFSFYSCGVVKHKDIVYTKSASGKDLTLNVFVPANAENKKLPVLLYIYGGNWNSGKKESYGFFGSNFAKKDVVTIIPNYTVSPEADVNEMTIEVAAAVKWVENNIEKYSGNTQKIFVTGHSAGGQLVSSAVLNPKYGIDETKIAGIILNDAAGIDMKDYLEKNPPTTQDDYLATWSNDPKNWYEASSIYFLNEKSPPFMIYLGAKTYPSITTANEHYVKKLNEFQPNVKPIIVNKKHVPMILQYFFPWSKRFDETLDFINKN